MRGGCAGGWEPDPAGPGWGGPAGRPRFGRPRGSLSKGASSPQGLSLWFRVRAEGGGARRSPGSAGSGGCLISEKALLVLGVGVKTKFQLKKNEIPFCCSGFGLPALIAHPAWTDA